MQIQLPNPKRLFELLLIAFALLMIFLMSSCSPEKRLLKAVNRYGQKESVALIASKYSQYFHSDSTPVPLIIIDTVPYVLMSDTSFDYTVLIQADSSTTLENKLLKVKVKRLADDYFRLKAELKEREIQVPVNVTDTIMVATQMVAPKYECPPQKNQTTWYEWVAIIGGYVLAILLIVYLLTRKK